MDKQHCLRVMGLLVLIVAIGALFLTYSTPGYADSVDLYWIGDDGNWSDTAHWSTSSGGAGGHAAPTSTNKVIFDAASFSSDGRVVTLNATGNCADMDWSDIDQTVTFSGSSALNIYGSLLMDASLTWSTTGTTTFKSTAAGKTITSISQTFNGAVTFDGVNGGWQLQDAFSCETGVLTITNGAVDTNGQDVTSGNVTGATGTNSLTLGATTWTCSGSWTGTLLDSLNADTSVIIFTGASTTFTGAGLTYYEVQFNGSGAVSVIGSNLFTDLTRTGTAITTDTILFSADQTITGTLTLTGNSSANRIACKSNTTAARTLTAAIVSETNCDFYFITGAGVGSWDFSGAAGGCANMGGNSGITFLNRVYWVAGTGDWNTATHLSGAGGGSAHDDFLLNAYNNSITSVYFDANSFTAGSQSMTISAAAVCYDMVWTGVTNTPTWAGSSTLWLYGSLTTVSAMTHTYSGTLTFMSTSGTKTITTDTLVLDSALTFNGVGGTWQLLDALNMGASATLTLANGTLDTNDQTVTVGTITGSSGIQHIDLGSSTINISVAWTATQFDSVTSGTSNIISTAAAGNFIGAGFTYYDITMTVVGTLTIWGDNTFHNITRVGTAVTTDQLIFYTGSTQTIEGTITCTGDSTVNRLRVGSSSGTAMCYLVAANVAITNCGLENITASGAGNWDLYNTGCINYRCTALTRGAGLGLIGIDLFIDDAYWVGASGGWMTPAGVSGGHWSDSSGGAPTDLARPGYNTNVHFDANSGFAVGNKTVTIFTSSPGSDGGVFCHDMDWTGSLNSPIFYITANDYYDEPACYVFGDATFVSGMTFPNDLNQNTAYKPILAFAGDGTHTITTNGAIFGSPSSGYSKLIYIGGGGASKYGGVYTAYSSTNGGGNYTIVGDMDLNGAASQGDNLLLLADQLDFGGYDSQSRSLMITGTAFAARVFDFDGSNLTCLTFSNSNNIDYLTISGAYTITVTGASSSTYNFAGGGETYYDVVFNWAEAGAVTSAAIGSATNTFHDFTLTGPAADTAQFRFDGNQTITGDLIITGASDGQRLKVSSATLTSAATITLSGSAIVEHAEFLDIVAAGAGSWNLSANDAGTLGNVTGITFPAPKNEYWIGDSGVWSDNTQWSLASGGGAATYIPLCQDIAVWDDHSFSGASQTVTYDVDRIGNLTTTAVTNNPALANSTVVNIYGTLNLGTMTMTAGGSGYNFYSRSNITLRTNNVIVPGPGDIEFWNHGATVTLGSNLTTVTDVFHVAGTLDLDTYNMTVTRFNSYTTTTYTRSLYLGSGVVTLTSEGAGAYKWRLSSTNLTFDAETSSIILTSTAGSSTYFAGANYTYNNLTISGSGAHLTTITGSNTFNNLVVSRLEAAKTVTFTAGTTQTVSEFAITPSTDSIVVVLKSSSTTNAIITKSAGLVYADYLDLDDLTATGGGTFYAGTHSSITDSPGWNASDPTPPTGSTAAASAIGGAIATLNGTVDTMGSYDTVYAFFEYGETVGYGDITSETTTTTPSLIQKPVGGLLSDTTYHFRLAIRYNVSEYIYGSDEEFTTTGAPVMVTGSAASITTTTAILQGTLDSLGTALSAECYFEYGLTVAYGTATVEQTKTATGSFNQSILGLSSGVTYHFRAAARYNGTEYSYGSDNTFVTIAATPPSITTNTAAAVNETTATFVGTITSVGTYSTVYANFEYGLTAGYGSTTPLQTFTTASGFIQAMSGLAQNTTYHYRATLTYNGTTIYGGDVAFTTTGTGSVTPGTEDPDILTIKDAKVISGYISAGDQMYLVTYQCLYESGTPTEPASEYFVIQVLNNSAIVGQWALPDWGYAPVGLYLGPGSALPYGGTYTIKIVGITNKWGVPPSTTRNLTSADWLGTDLLRLDDWVLTAAKSIGDYYSVDLITYTASGSVLNSSGCALFSRNISGLTSTRPQLCNAYATRPTSVAPGNTDSSYTDTWTASERLGPYINGLLQDGATAMDMEQSTFNNVMGIFLWSIAILILLVAFRGSFMAPLLTAPMLVGIAWVGLILPAVVVVLAVLNIVLLAYALLPRGTG